VDILAAQQKDMGSRLDSATQAAQALRQEADRLANNWDQALRQEADEAMRKAADEAARAKTNKANKAKKANSGDGEDEEGVEESQTPNPSEG
jgi:glutamyl-tRNA reductase